jgi:hypothetical protein
MLLTARRGDLHVRAAHMLVCCSVTCETIACSAPAVEQTACATGEDYLFHDHPLAEYDLGEKTLQCGRRADAFKFFLAWKYHSSQGFGAIIDHTMALSRRFRGLVEADHRFRVAVTSTDATNIVCFWWLPPPLRGEATLSAASLAALDELVPRMYAVMQERGHMLVRAAAVMRCVAAVMRCVAAVMLCVLAPSISVALLPRRLAFPTGELQSAAGRRPPSVFPSRVQQPADACRALASYARGVQHNRRVDNITIDD